MPSRKRQKGKERRAKAATQTADQDESEKVDWSQLGRLGECNHGCPIIAPRHSVSDLVNDVLEAASDENKFITDSMKLSLERHPQLWNDKENRKMAMHILISFTVNYILNGEIIEAGRPMASALLFLSNYDGLGSLDTAAYVCAALRRDIVCGNDREILRFFSKRIPCSCLKDLYKQSKRTLLKDGCCQNCKRVLHRSELMVCGNCRIIQFCSKECQRECWPEYKIWCSGYVAWKQSTVETHP